MGVSTRNLRAITFGKTRPPCRRMMRIISSMDTIANKSRDEIGGGAKPQPAWDDANLANPHEVADKRQRVREMFGAIAPSYDLNNRLHSLWQDQKWRKNAVK